MITMTDIKRKRNKTRFIVIGFAHVSDITQITDLVKV